MSVKITDYKKVSKQLLEYIGNKQNIKGVAHCATRLRIVLDSNDKANIKAIEELDGVKGVFIASNQLQIVFGAGIVNNVYKEFSKISGFENMSLSDVKSESTQKQNKFQQAIKSLSDVFVQIIPGLLAAALLMGITGLLGQKGIFGELSMIEMYPQLAGLNRFISIASTGIFTILPMLVVYSATMRFGGSPVLGLILGAIMLHPELANAYSVGNGSVVPEAIDLFGLKVELVGFQGGIIVALMMGFVVAKLDKFFNSKIHDMLKLFLAPICTVIVASFLLFIIVGPLGRGLANIVTSSLLWTTENLGVFGYMIFAGVQQVIVITGLHHVIGAVEAQLIADTGVNFIMPLMSVALIGQGGAILGYLVLNWKDIKARQIGISSFASVLFGISEPAIFGVTLKYKYPLIAGCIGGAIGGAYIYIAKVTALAFGATAVPGLAIVSTQGGGHVQYILAHLITMVVAMIVTILLGKLQKKSVN
ncbi:TPA: PTS transporter subunit EIIC [Clostridioides difficile]|uniref:PTS transporter subunit EIIC n=1 Tax=Clostridioides difficile TaxID=1496 RepID=UPI000317A938|nr:PTS transporter subunit EIIC [Clostridioides difficile]EKS6783702.1 PTS transporter subunit EIIC [Clostridioides difficile]MBY2552235.1 PTS transporter subunit EIIC [Clostridioides difficile]MDK3180050.1 PTS transporter subunit EIIC [Clostridioides difficile]PTL47391.1 PTS sugar transporter [Clostridioides difficile]PTL51927.1 PTS sugar transporter [Clostridioides difficile]